MKLLSKVFDKKQTKNYLAHIYHRHWTDKLKGNPVTLSIEENTAIAKETIRRGHGYALRGKNCIKIYYPIPESYNAMDGNWTWRMIESNSGELKTVSRNLSKTTREHQIGSSSATWQFPQSMQQMQMCKDSPKSFCKESL